MVIHGVDKFVAVAIIKEINKTFSALGLSLYPKTWTQYNPQICWGNTLAQIYQLLS